MGLKPNPLDLSSFSALTLLSHLTRKNPSPIIMTYNVFGGTLSLTQSIKALISVVSFYDKCKSSPQVSSPSLCPQIFSLNFTRLLV